MSLEHIKNTFQVIIYIGTGVIILGPILISLYPNIKLKWLFNIPIGFSISTLGAIILLIGTICFNIYSNKVDQKRQIEFDKQLTARDNLIKKNAEELLIINRFHAEVDNPIKSIYFILDLGSTLLADNFSDFSCVIRFDILDITIQFKTVHIDNPLSEKTEFIEARFVKGKNIENSPFITVGSSSFKNLSEFYMDLRLINKLLPKDFSVRDLSDQSFYFYLSEKQTAFVKGIKINVNNWDIFNKMDREIHWRELKQDWLPDRQDLRVFYQEYQNRFYDYNIIQFFREGFNYYEIVHYNVDTRSRISTNDVEKMLTTINDIEGSLLFDIDNKWRIKNNALIEYLPLITQNGLSIRIYRDVDNILKVSLSYKYAKNIILRCKYPENFSDSTEIHRLIITWNSNNAVFYIDGKEVDEFKVN